MIKKSVIYKLFGMTLLFFSILLGFIFLIQHVFLEDYYIKKKKETIIDNIETFAGVYSKQEWTLEETLTQIDLFIEKNNAPMIIVNEKGNIQHKNSEGNAVVIKSNAGEFYTINLNAFYEHLEIEPVVGANIRIFGTVFMDEKIFRDILKTEINGETYYDEAMIESIHNDMRSNVFPLGLNIVEVAGEIIYIDRHSEEEKTNYLSYKNNVLIGEIEEVFLTNKFSIQNIREETVLDYEILDVVFNNKNKVFIKPLLKDGSENAYIFVMTSFQPVNETLAILEMFNLYALLFAVILIILLSVIFTKMIASPLLELNQVAQRMAELDFTAKSSIESEDELGNLSKNLNVMSEKLSNSLEDLKNANEQLADDIERERKEEERRREFIADVSHELKTPLGIMRGYAEGIQDGIFESKKDYYLGVIINEIEKLDSMVLEMLTLSRIQSVGYHLDMTDLNLRALTNELLKKYEPIIMDKSLIIHKELSRVYGQGDEEKIYSVLDNFLSNAVKYSENGQQINVRLRDDRDHVYFYIENTGVFIPEDKLNNIWDRFYRLEHSRNRRFGGTGLGLNIVKNILTLHGSEFGVRNTSSGVEFYFSLEK